MDILAHNRLAWDKKVQDGIEWTVPVTPEEVAQARSGNLQVILTPTKLVPQNWFPNLKGLPILCLASGGGQQGPLLAAAGCEVTVFDNSPKQLEQDRFVAQREGLGIETVEGDMADLSVFDDSQFGLIFHPCSNCFVPDILPVWRECFRVLKPGGILMAGFCNPVRFIVEDYRLDNGGLQVRYPIPHSDADELGDPHVQHRILKEFDALEFGHTLADQIGGQLQAGFIITDFFEDKFHDSMADPISKYLDTLIATRAVKPRSATFR